jgi:hypothetical protein
MSDTTTDAATMVDLVLKRSGLPVTDEERERLIRLYPMVESWATPLRSPDTRYAEPALIYPPKTGG